MKGAATRRILELVGELEAEGLAVRSALFRHNNRKKVFEVGT